MSLRHAILGVPRPPLTGYDLVQYMHDSVGYVWSAPKSQIYPELRKMEEHGLVSATVAPRGQHAQKRIYAITDEGTVELSAGRRIGWSTHPTAIRSGSRRSSSTWRPRGRRATSSARTSCTTRDASPSGRSERRRSARGGSTSSSDASPSARRRSTRRSSSSRRSRSRATSRGPKPRSAGRSAGSSSSTGSRRAAPAPAAERGTGASGRARHRRLADVGRRLRRIG